MESGNSQLGCPFQICVDILSVDGEHVVTSRIKPVNIFSWRRIRWLKRRDMVFSPLV